MHRGGENEMSVHSFVYEVVFVYINSTSLDCLCFIYRVQTRKIALFTTQ